MTATDKGSGKKQDIKITGASTLPKDEVERMVNEAGKFAADDKKRREAVDTKNQAESMVYQTEKQLGKGGFGRVWRVRNKLDGVECVCLLMSASLMSASLRASDCLYECL